LVEISEPEGALIDIRKMLVGVLSMSFLELWTAEFRENAALLLKPEHEAPIGKSCQSERGPYAVARGDHRLREDVVEDSRGDSTPADRPLDEVLGEMPQKTFERKRLCNHRLREDVVEDSRGDSTRLIGPSMRFWVRGRRRHSR